MEERLRGRGGGGTRDAACWRSSPVFKMLEIILFFSINLRDFQEYLFITAAPMPSTEARDTVLSCLSADSW